jgi:hypothetical protein
MPSDFSHWLNIFRRSDEEPIKAPTSSPAQGRSFLWKGDGPVGQDSRIGALFFGMLLCSFQRFEGMLLASVRSLSGKLGASFNFAKNVP